MELFSGRSYGFMKKFALGLFTLLVLCLCVPVWGQEEVPAVQEWETAENDKGLTLTAYLGREREIIIPEELDGKPVTSLGKELFKDNDRIRSVYIPDSVETIGANAFNGCPALTEARLPQNLKKIENGLFRYCINLEQIVIPFKVSSIGSFAFADCVHLKEIVLIETATIGEAAFSNCQSLETVFVSRKLNKVDADAFLDTPWLDAQTDEFVFIGHKILLKYNGTDTNVAIPEGTTAISNAFDGNRNLESVKMPEGLLHISQYAFRGAENLSKITIPQSVTEIGSGAFQNCRSLSAIDLPESIKSVGGSAFRGCEKLTSLIFPTQVTNIQNSVGRECPALGDVVIPEGTTKFHKDAFLDSPNVNIMIIKGSPVEGILKESGISFNYYQWDGRNIIPLPRIDVAAVTE